MAESKGKSCAIGDVSLQQGNWGPSIGLFQIRSFNTDRGTGSTRDQDANLDPRTNAHHAYELWLREGKWHPWSTWIHGTYKQYLQG